MASTAMRRDSRTPICAQALFQWENECGESMMARTKTVDVSEDGLCVELPVSVPLRTLITFRVPDLDLGGRASVRSCRPKGIKHLVGLEFVGGLRWQPSADGARPHRKYD